MTGERVSPQSPSNLHEPTVRGYGEVWAHVPRQPARVAQELFEVTFALMPPADLRDGEGFDLGCGAGRFARAIAPHVRKLHCIDVNESAIAAARANLDGRDNVAFHVAGVDEIPLGDGSQDFGYSIGVLHHIPDTESALASCVAKLKPGAPFLVYIYYAFDNRAWWYRALWRVSDVVRRGVCRLPYGPRNAVSTMIALIVYWPLSRAALLLERLGFDVEGFPLSFYRRIPGKALRSCSLDRFGTVLEQRFSRSEIRTMMTRAGLVDIAFNDGPPWWIACGRKG
jgi:SAM-dependent methyltransferase